MEYFSVTIIGNLTGEVAANIKNDTGYDRVTSLYYAIAEML